MSKLCFKENVYQKAGSFISKNEEEGSGLIQIKPVIVSRDITNHLLHYTEICSSCFEADESGQLRLPQTEHSSARCMLVYSSPAILLSCGNEVHYLLLFT